MSEDLTFVTDEAGDEQTPRRRGRRTGQSEPTVEAEPTQTVTVTVPFRVTYEGRSYFPGEVPTVPNEIALQWLKAHWVTEE